MRVSVTEAKGQLTELVRRAEAGDLAQRHGGDVRMVAELFARIDVGKMGFHRLDAGAGEGISQF